MSNSSAAKLLIYAALPLMAISLLQKPLGLNEWAQRILGLVAVLLLWTGISLQRRTKGAGEPVAIPSTQQRRNRLFLLGTIVVVTTLSGPLWLPILGPALPLHQLVVVSLISCAVSLAVLFFAARKWPKA